MKPWSLKLMWNATGPKKEGHCWTPMSWNQCIAIAFSRPICASWVWNLCYQALTKFCSLHSHNTTTIFSTVSDYHWAQVWVFPPWREKRMIPYLAIRTHNCLKFTWWSSTSAFHSTIEYTQISGQFQSDWKALVEGLLHPLDTSHMQLPNCITWDWHLIWCEDDPPNILDSTILQAITVK